MNKYKSTIPDVQRWDGLKFELFWRDDLISRVHVDGTTVYIDRLIQHPAKQLFWTNKMNIFQLSMIFEDRCWERNRDDIDDIIHNLGLKSYDLFEITKLTHGTNYNDCLWFKFEGENISFIDVMPRNRRGNPVIWQIKKSYIHLKRALNRRLNKYCFY